jgi:Retrotransposon gag protein
MADPTLMARARKARYDDLPSFSGQTSEDAERFLKNIKNITKARDDSVDPQMLEIVRGKLTQSAGVWFDDHESQFTKWSDFVEAFRNRYFSTTMISTKFEKLKQRKQQYNESVISYYDDVVTLCREIDSRMPDTVIIQHLMTGINPEFRRELSRRESAMQALAEFMKYAKLEQDLHDTTEQLHEHKIQPQQQYLTYHLASNPIYTSSSSKPTHHSTIQNQHEPSHIQQSSNMNWNSYEKHPGNMSSIDVKPEGMKGATGSRNFRTTRTSGSPKYYTCKVCGLQNHRSIDCPNKRQSGCYNCGDNHAVRDCQQPPHFQ